MFANSIEDLPNKDTMLSMSGLAFMQAVRDHALPTAPIGQTIGYDIHAVEDGMVEFRGTPEFKATNPMGTVHGGWYGTLLDSCMACAVMTKVPKGSWYTTLEFKVNIARNLPLGTLVAARGVVQHAGRTTGIATGELRGVDDGKLYATGSTTCIILKG